MNQANNLAQVDVLAVMDDAAEVMGRDGYSAIPNDLIEARAAVAELVAAADAFARDDRQRAWHAAYRPMMDRLRAALRPFNGSDKA